MQMLECKDLTSAKAMMVDGMSMDSKPVGTSTVEKKDPWSDFK